MHRGLTTASTDFLSQLSDRLYCASQAVLHGDVLVHEHNARIGAELTCIWLELEEVLFQEQTNSQTGANIVKADFGEPSA